MNIGLPHSEITRTKLTYNSPRHIGVSPVLHRLLVPSHPPCALLHLINSLLEIIHFSMSLFKILLFSFQGTKMEPSGIEPLTSCVQGRRSAVDRKSTRLNSSHVAISYAVFCLKKRRNGTQR